MNENVPADTNLEIRRKPPRLWPWVVGLIGLGVCAIAFSLWQQTERVRQLREFALRAPGGGRYKIDYNHPGWMDLIVSRKTYLPYFDELTEYSVAGTPLSEELFSALLNQRSLQSVEIDISKCSPESISGLQRLSHLEAVELHGNCTEIPLEWTQKLPELEQLGFENIPVSANNWPLLIALPKVDGLTASDSSTYVSDYGGGPYLWLSRDHLTKADAQALVAVKGLKYLDLVWTRADPEFWEELSKLPTLHALGLTNNAPGKFELSQTELQALKEIASLKTLQMFDHIDVTSTDDVSPAWQEFLDQRPDTYVRQLSSNGAK